MPVSPADLQRWEAFGGEVHDSKGRKTYTAPSGKKLKSWKDAQRLLERKQEGTVLFAHVNVSLPLVSHPLSAYPATFVIALYMVTDMFYSIDVAYYLPAPSGILNSVFNEDSEVVAQGCKKEIATTKSRQHHVRGQKLQL